mgnify:CR=1 FL=1
MKMSVILSEAKDLHALQSVRRFLATLGMTIISHAIAPSGRRGLEAELTPETISLFNQYIYNAGFTRNPIESQIDEH